MPVHSPLPDVDVPAVDIATYIFGRAQKHCDQRAAAGLTDEPPLLVDGVTGESLTFTEVMRESEAVAAALVERGLSLDAVVADTGLTQVVAIYAPLTIHACTVHYGALLAGGTYTYIPPTMAGPALVERLAEVRPAVVFVAPSLLPQLQEALAQLPANVDIVLTRGSEASYPSLDSLPVVPSGTMLRRLAVSGADMAGRAALIVYTSGSTGRPKGVAITHRRALAIFAALGEFFRGAWGFDPHVYLPPIQGQFRVLSEREPWHLFGHIGLCYCTLMSGDMYVQLPECTPAQYLAAVEKHRIDYLYASPAILHRVFTETTRVGLRRLALKADSEQVFDIGTIKAAGSAASSALLHRFRQYSDHLGGVPIFDGYGQSEAGFIAGSGSRIKPVPGYLVLCPNIVAKVIDTDGSEADGYGELCVSSPQCLRHYLDGKSTTTDSDGYLHTGDYAHLTADGQVCIKGRMEELVRTAAGIVCPADIDNELAQLPAIRDSILVARGDARPVALIALEPSLDVPELDVPALLANIEQTIYQRTGTAIECRKVARVPRATTGKIIWPQANAMVGSE
ncbi:4-coumarate--CoA ligase [Coemansia spiralis]|nr:4-coumarate--CoA ligase [Coemansia spiralis]